MHIYLKHVMHGCRQLSQSERESMTLLHNPKPKPYASKQRIKGSVFSGSRTLAIYQLFLQIVHKMSKVMQNATN